MTHGARVNTPDKGEDMKRVSQKERRHLRPHHNPVTKLAPLVSFDPGVLKGDARGADSLVLLLAVVYNDLRELMWAVEHLQTTKPRKVEVSPDMGDWQGASVWTKRYGAAILNELLVSVKDAKKAGILEQPTFVRTVGALDENERTGWFNIVAVAMGEHNTSELREFFDRVRNRAAFHFDRGRLWEGYAHHFTRLKKDAFNERAYMSVGRTVGATRFYFADAAAQHALELYDEKGELWPLVNVVLTSVHVALRAVVDTHIRFRIQDAERKG